MTIENEWNMKSQQFFFQPTTNEQTFLFIHQTEEQKKLLSKYGGELCLLDATHRTTKYALFLFFIVVKTNVDYQVLVDANSSGNYICYLKLLTIYVVYCYYLVLALSKNLIFSVLGKM